LVQSIETKGLDYEWLMKTMGNRSKRAISTFIRKVQERFDSKKDLSEVEQKLILALHKPKVNEASVPEPAPVESVNV
jgi:hypothetical protein